MDKEPIDLKLIRQDTPACLDKLFLNSAGASLMPKPIIECIHQYLRLEESLGGYKVAEIQHDRIEEFYEVAANFINAKAHQIAFAFSATEAYAKALSSIPFDAGDVIITSNDDYVSNYLNFISLKRRLKINIIRIRNLENGDIDLNDLEQKILKHQPKLLSLTHIPTSSGLVQDAINVGNLCEKYDVLYLLDACQSIGQLPIDVEEIKCDFLSCTGRKFLRGPRGTGMLYVSDKVLLQDYVPLFVDLRGASWTTEDQYELKKSAKRFETWELPYSLLIGLKEAIVYASHIGIENINIYNNKIINTLRENLKAIDGVEMFDLGSNTCNILTFRKEGKTLNDIKSKLDQHKVFYSTTFRESAVIDFDKKGIDWNVRLSPHYFNTKEEMNEVAAIIDEI